MTIITLSNVKEYGCDFVEPVPFFFKQEIISLNTSEWIKFLIFLKTRTECPISPTSEPIICALVT